MTDEYAEREAFIADQVELSKLRAELAAALKRVEELEGAGHQALTVVRDVLRWERPSNALRSDLETVEANLSAALSGSVKPHE